MPSDRTPHPGQVYRSPSGRPALYVRTEKRPGAKGREHLLIETGDRVVLERWHPADVPFPERYELALDPEALARADELEGQVAELRRERAALLATMRRAVAMVPVTVANEMRRAYREAMRS